MFFPWEGKPPYISGFSRFFRFSFFNNYPLILYVVQHWYYMGHKKRPQKPTTRIQNSGWQRVKTYNWSLTIIALLPRSTQGGKLCKLNPAGVKLSFNNNSFGTHAPTHPASKPPFQKSNEVTQPKPQLN